MGKLYSFFVDPRFQIKSGYFHRKEVVPFDDTKNTDEWQKEVYEYSLSVALDNEHHNVMDFGCGSGHKLLKYFAKDFNTIGLEIEPALSYLKSEYPNYIWEEYEPDKKYICDLLILSDVVEHIKDPRALFNSFLYSIEFKYLVVSTPDRDLIKNAYAFGPPLNTSHFREWNFCEFRLFMEEFFDILDHKITNEDQATQLILCRKKEK